MDINKETPKRLQLLTSTVQKLYARSGNICAFTGCDVRLYPIDDSQNVSNICHIEAANIGGERFNPNQTNEDRRHYDNLILLCPNHHKTTNDVEEYTVSTLKKMKKDHEEFIDTMLRAQEEVLTRPSILYDVITCIANSISEILDTTPSVNTAPFDIDTKIAYNSIMKYKEIFQEYSSYQCGINTVYEEIEAYGTQKNSKLLLTHKVRSLYLKLKTQISNPDLIIDEIKKELLELDLDNCNLNNEVIGISLDIIIVDIFMRCKIFTPPPKNKNQEDKSDNRGANKS